MGGSDYDLPSLFPAQELKEPYCTFLFLAHFVLIREGFDRVLLLLFPTALIREGFDRLRHDAKPARKQQDASRERHCHHWRQWVTSALVGGCGGARRRRWRRLFRPPW